MQNKQTKCIFLKLKSKSFCELIICDLIEWNFELFVQKLDDFTILQLLFFNFEIIVSKIIFFL